MTTGPNRVVAGQMLVVSALLMIVGAVLVWTGTFAIEPPTRTYVALALGAAGVADLLIAVFFFFRSGG